MKEDHCDTAGLSKNRTEWVFLRGIDCTYTPSHTDVCRSLIIESLKLCQAEPLLLLERSPITYKWPLCQPCHMRFLGLWTLDKQSFSSDSSSHINVSQQKTDLSNFYLFWNVTASELFFFQKVPLHDLSEQRFPTNRQQTYRNNQLINHPSPRP